MLDPSERERLFEVSWRVIEGGVDDPWRRSISAEDYSEVLRDRRASFVTLSRNGTLRGCCGQLRPTRPLVVDVAENAWTTAFRDPRFAPLEADELPGLRLELSLLSPLEVLVGITDRAGLLARLRPGRDGLFIRAPGRQATFLPKVWKALPDGDEFVDHLLQKGGFADWPGDAQFFTYTTESFACDYRG